MCWLRALISHGLQIRCRILDSSSCIDEALSSSSVPTNQFIPATTRPDQASPTSPTVGMQAIMPSPAPVCWLQGELPMPIRRARAIAGGHPESRRRERTSMCLSLLLLNGYLTI